MKKLLIIYPHWHPANLAGVHRPRLIGNYLKDFGWKPRVLTVFPEYFEEKPDPDFEKTFSSDFEVTRVKALKVTRPRIIGDIGLRAFFQLYKGAKKIIENEEIDFIWLPIPSFYNALLGRLLYEKCKVPYGIDYIDPWVRDLSNQRNWRAVFSQWVARFLEPIAVKKASLISGVSFPYYEPVLQRNFPNLLSPKTYSLNSKNLNPNSSTPNSKPKTQNSKLLTHVAMPYGFDPNDHKIKLDNLNFPWGNDSNKKIWMYAGAFLPNSHILMDAFFKSISNLRKNGQWDENIQLWFIGTGPYPAKRITSYAKDHSIEDIVFEKRERYPFLQILNFLSAANTVMIIGSTEKHYTASKTYQSLLSHRPVVSIFHHESSAIKVMEDCKADQFTVRYKPNMNTDDIAKSFEEVMLKRLSEKHWNPDLSALYQYSAKESARKLVEAIEKTL